jgi:vacuolar protein sorting-associated protein 45
VKKQPSSIVTTLSSPATQRVAKELQKLSAADDLFVFRDGEMRSPMLLLLDRADDPVTPLLSQWTYQAMVHELLGMNNNRVILRGAPGVKKELEEVVLSPQADEFFGQHR